MKTKYNVGPNIYVIKRLMAGDSLMRALFNSAIKKYRLSGEVLDIGGKSANASYYSHIIKDDKTRITVTDINDEQGAEILDIEKPFQIKDEVFDIILSFHLFEHVFHFGNCMGEIKRTLKNNGKFILCAPFMYPYHGDPSDYWRFTDKALIKLGEENGFKLKSVECIGEGMFTSACLYVPELMNKIPILKKIITIFAYILCSILDKIIFKVQKNKERKMCDRFALEYIVVFEK